MTAPPSVSGRDAWSLWSRIGWTSFGGPAGQISLMHRAVVDDRGWVSEERFLHALSFCTLLPGPEAQQLATYLGLGDARGTRRRRRREPCSSCPGFLVMWILSALYAVYGSVDAVEGLLAGLQAAVIPIVVDALLRVGPPGAARTVVRGPCRRLLRGGVVPRRPVPRSSWPSPWRWAPGCCGRAPPPARRRRGRGRRHPDGSGAPPCSPGWRPPPSGSCRWPSSSPPWGATTCSSQEAVFFSKTALVTFGGAYAVLGYVAQQAVSTYGWVTPNDMVTGLGLAETTPGPLIMVVQFVGFLGAYNDPGPLPPLRRRHPGCRRHRVGDLPPVLHVHLPRRAVRRTPPPPATARRAPCAASPQRSSGVIASLALYFTLHVAFGTVGTDEVGPLTIPTPTGRPCSGASADRPCWPPSRSSGCAGASCTRSRARRPARPPRRAPRGRARLQPGLEQSR